MADGQALDSAAAAAAAANFGTPPAPKAEAPAVTTPPAPKAEAPAVTTPPAPKAEAPAVTTLPAPKAEAPAVTTLPAPQTPAPVVTTAPTETKEKAVLTSANEAKMAADLFLETFKVSTAPKGELKDGNSTNDQDGLQKIRDKAAWLDTSKLDKYMEAHKGEAVRNTNVAVLMRELAGEMYDHRRAIDSGTLTKADAQGLLDKVVGALESKERASYDPRFVQDAKWFAEQIEAKQNAAK